MDDDFDMGGDEWLDDIETFADLGEDDEVDAEELAYWDEFQRQERQAAYDEEWGDPLDMPSYGE